MIRVTFPTYCLQRAPNLRGSVDPEWLMAQHWVFWGLRKSFEWHSMPMRALAEYAMLRSYIFRARYFTSEPTAAAYRRCANELYTNHLEGRVPW